MNIFLTPVSGMTFIPISVKMKVIEVLSRQESSRNFPYLDN